MGYYIANWQDINTRVDIVCDEGTDVSALPTHFCPGSTATVIGNKIYQLSASYEWEVAPSQGSGASSWTDLTDKPFESIGTGLEVDDDGALNATATSAVWGNITGDIDDQTDLIDKFDSIYAAQFKQWEEDD